MPKDFQVILILVLFQVPCFSQGKFTNIAEAVGIQHTYGIGLPSGGVSAVDFDGDGLDDITLTTGSGSNLKFYLNMGNTFSLLELSLPSTDGESKQVIWVDFDNDGDKDLYITFLDSKNRLFRNDGNLTFTDITTSSGLDRDFLPTYSAAWADYDRDGYLDLYITDRKTGIFNQDMSNHLYRNQGDATFVESTIIAHVADSAKAPFCAYFLDYDNDGWEDIYIAQDKKTINTLFRNNHNGTFQNVSMETFTDLAMDAMSVTVGDYNNNGFLDIYITNISDGNKLLRNDGFGFFTEVANNTGTGFFNIGWGAQFLDIDNDKDLDLYVNGSRTGVSIPPSALFINSGEGRFENSVIAGDTATSFSNAVGDFNNDGFPDIVVNNPSPFKTFLWSNGNTFNNWISIDLEGVLSNRDGIGTRMEVYLDGVKYIQHKQCGTGFLGQNSSVNNFGIGQHSHVDSLIIKWPSGHVERLFNVISNTKHHYKEGEVMAFRPKLSHSGEIILCYGDSILVNAGLYSGALSYLWSNGSTESTLKIRESGKFAVLVTNTDLGIHYISDTVIVSVLSELVPEINYSKNNISCFGMHDGSISMNITGTGNYSINWSNGSQGLSLDNIAPGIYNYTVKYSSGCSINGSVSIYEPDSIGVLIDQLEFEEGSTVRVRASGGNPPYTYSWGHSNETGPEVFITDNGNYDVTVSDSNGCSKTILFTIDNSFVTALENDGFINAINVYPNPTNGDINIRWNRSSDVVEMVVLRDIFGKEIRRTSLMNDRNTIGLTMRGITSGFYLISIILKSGEIDVRRVQLY